MTRVHHPPCQKSQTISEIFIPVRLSETRLTDNKIRRCLLKIRVLSYTIAVRFHHFVARRSNIKSLKRDSVYRWLVNIPCPLLISSKLTFPLTVGFSRF